MDITETIAPRSDQLNFDDVAVRAVTVTVEEVRAGTAEQPVEVHLVEFPGRPFKPSKSMRRVLAKVWGAEASEWVGRSMTLYGDPTVKFGGQEVGGIRISHMSHLDKPVQIALTVTRGKRAPFTVQPLAVVDAALHLEAIGAAEDMDALKAAWEAAVKAGVGKRQDILAATNHRKAELAEAVEQ